MNGMEMKDERTEIVLSHPLCFRRRVNILSKNCFFKGELPIMIGVLYL